MKCKKILSALLAVVMLLSMMPTVFAAVGDDNTTGQPVWPNEGAINLDKTAQAVGGEDNLWEITLTIEGKNFKTASDVVLVIDVSGSMKDNDRLKNTKTAAKAFGEKLLTADSQTRIAIVTYNEKASSKGVWYTFETKGAFNNEIDGLTANGGTNQQAGIHLADELLYAESNNHLKNIVLLTDGAATFSHKVTSAYIAGTLTCSDYWILGHSFTFTPDESTVQIDSCDYSKIVGDGSNFELKEDSYRSGYSNDYPTKYTTNVDGTECEHGKTYTSNYYGNNGIPTIWEAGLTKAKGTTIFSVALEAGTNGENVLKSCATDPTESKGYFAIASSDNISEKLTSAFEAIAGSIAIAASQGNVTDPMGDDVDLSFAGSAPVSTNDQSVYNAGSADVYISQGTLTYDATEDTIHWNVGNINEGTTATMKYKVKLRSGYNPETGTVLPTNGHTFFEYKNYQQQDTHKDFPIPEVTIGGGTILKHYYLVNANGKPINEDGVVVDGPAYAKQIQAPAYVQNDQGTNGLEYGQYTVPFDAIKDYTYYGYIVNDGAMMTGDKATVDLQASHSNQEVWFAYRQCFSVHHSSNGDIVTYDIAGNGNFDITSVVYKDCLYGGTFNQDTHDSIWQFGSENPTNFTPKAGATYYLREVSDSYLCPKVLSVWKPYYGTSDEYDVIGMYLLTAIDDEKYYTQLGFDVTQNEQTTQYLSGDETEGVAYDHVNTVQSGNATSHTARSVFNLDGVLGCSQVVNFKNDYGNDELTMMPYWITLDGVRVTGVVERTSKYIGRGANALNKKINTVKETTYPTTATYVSTADATDMAPLTLQACFVASDEEPAVDSITVTKVENGASTTVSCEPGDLRGVISYEELSGMRFAGWFADADYRTPADLSQVENDITIYGKYISDANLDVHVQTNIGFGSSRKFSVFTPVDTKNYAEIGCRVVVNGTVFEENMYKYNSIFNKVYLGIWFDYRLPSSTLLYTTGTISAKRGDSVTVQPYWVTLDGTTVYGVEQTVVMR